MPFTDSNTFPCAYTVWYWPLPLRVNPNDRKWGKREFGVDIWILRVLIALTILLWWWIYLVKWIRFLLFSLLWQGGQRYKPLSLHVVPVFYLAESCLLSHKATLWWLKLSDVATYFCSWLLIIVLEVDDLKSDIISAYFLLLMQCLVYWLLQHAFE